MRRADGSLKDTYDTLVGYHHDIEARNQSIGANNYAFSSWSDGGAPQHTLVAPSSAQSYVATYNVTSPPATPAFVQIRSTTPQTPQSTVSVAYANAQSAGNTNIVAIGWNSTISTISSVGDSAGNVYQLRHRSRAVAASARPFTMPRTSRLLAREATR